MKLLLISKFKLPRFQLGPAHASQPDVHHEAKGERNVSLEYQLWKHQIILHDALLEEIP